MKWWSNVVLECAAETVTTNADIGQVQIGEFFGTGLEAWVGRKSRRAQDDAFR